MFFFCLFLFQVFYVNFSNVLKLSNLYILFLILDYVGTFFIKKEYIVKGESPSNMETEIWRDDNLMNLYFKSFDQITDEKNFNIATATLRLYRIPTENLTRSSTKQPDCDGNTSTEEEKLLRVSIYWYTKSPRKKKGKYSII